MWHAQQPQYCSEHCRSHPMGNMISKNYISALLREAGLPSSEAPTAHAVGHTAKSQKYNHIAACVRPWGPHRFKAMKRLDVVLLRNPVCPCRSCAKTGQLLQHSPPAYTYLTACVVPNLPAHLGSDRCTYEQDHWQSGWIKCCEQSYSSLTE